MQLTIADKTIGPQSPVFIIAEAGVNHNADLSLALAMVEKAARAGVDAVKFQAFKTEELCLDSVEQAPYQAESAPQKGGQAAMLKALEVDRAFLAACREACQRAGVVFLCTPYDLPSLAMLAQMGAPALKAASTDVTNGPFLAAMAQTGLPVLLSTGMSRLGEIDQAVVTLREHGCGQLALLQCTSLYPAPEDLANLRAIARLGQIFDAPVGFSDHTPGVGASPYAVAAGARIVEKHFTLDKSMPGPDHKASLDPAELQELVREVRRVERMLGSGRVGMSPAEETNRRFLQKSLVAARPIARGQRIELADLKAMRCGGGGLSAAMAREVAGKRAREDLAPNQPLQWTHIADD